MSIRIIPQDELGSSEKRTAEYIPPLLFPRLKNLYNRRAERLRELAENNPLGDFLRFAALVFLVVCAPLVTLFAQPVVDYATRAARQVHDGPAYVRDVLGTPPEAAPARTVRPNRTPYSGERSP